MSDEQENGKTKKDRKKSIDLFDLINAYDALRAAGLGIEDAKLESLRALRTKVAEEAAKVMGVPLGELRPCVYRTLDQ